MIILLILILNLLLSSGFDTGCPESAYHLESQLIEQSLEMNREGDLSWVQQDNRRKLDDCFFNDQSVSCYNRAIRPVEHSTLEKQIERLENTIGKCLSCFYKDESLRRQIWNLGKSLQSLRESKRMCYLRPKAIRVLERAILYYNSLKEEMAFQVSTHYSPIDSDLAGISRNPEVLYTYAAYFEKKLCKTPMQKNKQRCEATARAIIGYYLKNQMINVNIKDKFAHPEKGFNNLKKAIEASSRKLIVIDCEKLDHMLIIEKINDRAYRFLQSFVNHYSLEASLAENKIYTKGEMLTAIDQLKTLLKGKKWNSDKEELYHCLFHARPSSHVICDYPTKQCDLQFVSLPINNHE